MLILDDIAIPTESMLIASRYYPRYCGHGGKRVYQEYIQLVEREIDGGAKTAMSSFMQDYIGEFIGMAQWSNDYWADINANQSDGGDG